VDCRTCGCIDTYEYLFEREGWHSFFLSFLVAVIKLPGEREPEDWSTFDDFLRMCTKKPKRFFISVPLQQEI
jgi:hypothetical protein